MTLRFLILIGLVSVFSACTRRSEAPRVLNLGIWSNYLAPEVLAEFERARGVKVQVTNYSSNEELLAKFQAGAAGFDVVVPSDYMVQALIHLNLIRKLDRSLIPNARALDRRYLGKPYDAANDFSLPYDVGTTGIAVNRSLYRGEIQGWKQFFTAPGLAGKMTLLDDSREVIGAALKSLGFSLNSTDPAQLAQAKAVLVSARPRVKSFTSETWVPLRQGETAVMHAYVSDAMQARKASGGKIEFILPREGGTFWVDNLVIPASTRNVGDAHALINFLLEPKVQRSTVLSVFVTPASQGAFALLPEGFAREYPAMFPSDEVLSRYEMIEDLGEATQLWDRIWTELKAGR